MGGGGAGGVSFGAFYCNATATETDVTATGGIAGTGGSSGKRTRRS